VKKIGQLPWGEIPKRTAGFSKNEGGKVFEKGKKTSGLTDPWWKREKAPGKAVCPHVKRKKEKISGNSMS